MMKQSIKIVRIAAQKLVNLLVVITMLNQCTSPEIQSVEEIEYRKELSSELYKIRSEDSLQTILQQFIEEKNDVGKMMCYKRIGARQRENSRFSDAISSHQKG